MECEDMDLINNMLEAATKLQVFKSRKLQVFGGDNLVFNSNNLKEITLTRSDCLTGITLWAPHLKILNLTSSFAIEDIDILNDHPLRATLPADVKLSKFEINLTNVCESGKLAAKFRNHPRVRNVIFEERRR